MLCSQVQLVKRGEGYEDIKPLPCRMWSCEYCQPKRKLELIARCISGDPNKILTLTVSPDVESSPLARRKLLAKAWANLCKRIHRQFQLPAPRRWQLKARLRSPSSHARLRAITAETPAQTVTRVAFFAFVERTKRGEPHLHILLRMPYIPQDWIAEQMGELAGSPICWIEQIRQTRQAVNYVTKYVAKEPAQFGRCKRHWCSRGWCVDRDDGDWRDRPRFTPDVVRRERWSETLAALLRDGRPWRTVEPGVYRIFEHRHMPAHWGRYASVLDST